MRLRKPPDRPAGRSTGQPTTGPTGRLSTSLGRALEGSPVVRGIVRTLGRLVAPGACCLCRAPLANPLGGPICPSCASGLRALDVPACGRCGLFYRPDVAPGPCGPCRVEERPYRRALSAARHEGVVRGAILELKFRKREPIATPLAAMLVEALEVAADRGEPLAPPTALVPMPLPFWRGRRRGFNQSRLLAEALATRLNVPVLTRTLRKRRRPPQAGLPARDRAKNVRGAFRVRRLPEAMVGGSFLLVDDVFTTGSTAAAAALALTRAGASAVDVLTVARGSNPPG